MHKILITDKIGGAGLERLDEIEEMSYDVRTRLSPEELVAIMPEYDAMIIRSSTQVNADVIAAGKKLKVIGRAGIGVDNIDIEAATRRGIIVMNTPQANSVATAEQTIGLMIAVSRHTAQSHAALLSGLWQRSQFVGTELKGKTLGIVGFGRIGRLVAERAQAFGMHVIAYDPYVSEAVGRNTNVELVDLEDLYAQADYITLHSVLTKETEKLINAEAIARMKDGVFIVNVARGKLVDEDALAAALQSGKVQAAAVDVYTTEPPENSPLLGLPNVLHTPHLGASTREAMREVALQMVEQVVDALKKRDIRNALNVPFHAGPNFEGIRPYMALAEKLGTLHCYLAPAPITKLEIEVTGEGLEEAVRPVAAAMLKGLLSHRYPEINDVNAPVIAKEQGIEVSQAYDLRTADYTNLISCRAYWRRDGEAGSRLLAGVLFGDRQPRIVQVDEYRLEAKPEGIVLFMRNRDVPGVIGQVATLLATYEINIGEWRLGRTEPGGEAISFINLDSEPPEPVLEALKRAKAVTGVQLIHL